MADVGTMTTGGSTGPPAPADGGGGRGPGGRRIRRARNLPGSRAVVGALLVAAAAVGVFAAYLDAAAEPDSRYVIAAGEVPIGTLLTEDLLRDPRRFGVVAVDLPAQVAETSVTEEAALGLAGRVTTAPLAPGDLLSRSGLASGATADDVVQLSFAIEASRAVGGALEPGDRVDVAVTYGSGPESYTLYVARAALVADVDLPTEGLDSRSVVLTLSLPDDEVVLAVAQAVNTGAVFVTRSSRASERTAVEPYAPPATFEDAAPVAPGEPASGGPAAVVPVPETPPDAVPEPATGPGPDAEPEPEPEPDAEPEPEPETEIDEEG
jgi:Flp pilus assembly protein CpaB